MISKLRHLCHMVSRIHQVEMGLVSLVTDFLLLVVSVIF